MKPSLSILPIQKSIEALNSNLSQTDNENVQALLSRAKQANLTPLFDLPIGEARIEFERRCSVLELESEEVRKIEDITLSASDGTNIAARIYWGTSCSYEALVMFVHGGGWVLGSIKGYDRLCRRFANRINLPIVSIEYRLAPEHPLPIAIQDISLAIQARSSILNTAGVKTKNWSIMGDSAGGNLIIASLSGLSDADQPNHQTLIYPVTDLAGNFPSRNKFAEGYLLDKSLMDWFSKLYLNNSHPKDPKASPIYNPKIRRGPKTLMVTAGLDPLRDEGIAYANSLHKAGNEVEHLHCEDMLHGFLSMPLALPEAIAITDVASAHIRRVLVN